MNPDVIIEAQNDSLERPLWGAVKILEGSAPLSGRVAKRPACRATRCLARPSNARNTRG